MYKSSLVESYEYMIEDDTDVSVSSLDRVVPQDEVKERKKGSPIIPYGSKEYKLREATRSFFKDKDISADFDTIVLMLNFPSYQAKNHEGNNEVLESICSAVGARLHNVKTTNGTGYDITEDKKIQNEVYRACRIKRDNSIRNRFYNGFTSVWLIEYQGCYIPVEAHTQRLGLYINIFGLNQIGEDKARSTAKRELLELLVKVESMDNMENPSLNWYLYSYDFSIDIKTTWSKFVDEFIEPFINLLNNTNEDGLIHKRKVPYNFYYGDTILSKFEVKELGSCYLKPLSTGKMVGDKFVPTFDKRNKKRRTSYTTSYTFYDKIKKYEHPRKRNDKLNYTLVRFEKKHTFNGVEKLSLNRFSPTLQDKLFEEEEVKMFRNLNDNKVNIFGMEHVPCGVLDVEGKVIRMELFNVGEGRLSKVLERLHRYNLGSVVSGGYCNKW